jgi:nitroreductase
MKPIDAKHLIDNLSWRYAVKKFDASKKIPAETWSALEQAMVLSPSSFGLQPWKFFVVTDPAVREKLKPASWNQPQITDASHLVVFARKTSVTRDDVQGYIDRIASVRNQPTAAIEDYKQMMVGFVERPAPAFDVNVWATKQVYLALGFFLEACAMLGVDACPMEGFIGAQYDQILGLAPGGSRGNGAYASCVLATVGYRSSEDWLGGARKVRFAHDQMIEHI